MPLGGLAPGGGDGKGLELARAWSGEALARLGALRRSQAAAVRQAAALLADGIERGGIVYTFGSGHSHMAAEEVFVRAGTLACVRALYPTLALDAVERVEGVGRELFRRVDLRPEDSLIVVSQSGVNPLPVEAALEARARGLATVAITSFEHSRAVEPRHSSGLRLMECVDVALDNGVPAGDALLDVGLPVKVGPLSSLAAILLMQMLLVATTGELLARGLTPPVRMSRNLPGGDEYDRLFVERYGDRIPELRL